MLVMQFVLKIKIKSIFDKNHFEKIPVVLLFIDFDRGVLLKKRKQKLFHFILSLVFFYIGGWIKFDKPHVGQ